MDFYRSSFAIPKFFPTSISQLTWQQGEIVRWGISGSGPTLVKGGPGTGKTVVALYRAKTLAEELWNSGISEPRILFTTYTNTLVNFCEQVLTYLLGEPIESTGIKVTTVDKIVRKHSEVNFSMVLDDGSETVKITELAKEKINREIIKSLNQTIPAKLSTDFVDEEIRRVIQARSITRLEDYLQAPRFKRKVGLNGHEREVVWKIYEQFQQLMQENGRYTWQQVRNMTLEAIKKGRPTQKYDAVIIDEAHDLDPNSLKLLVELSKIPNRIFVTADANQTIYGSGFNWNDVHESLKFRGHTRILRKNFRSTLEITKAAHSYIQNQVIDPEVTELVSLQNGLKPLFRNVDDFEEEVYTIGQFIKATVVELNLDIGSCLILCPKHDDCEMLANKLCEIGIFAKHMPKDEFDTFSQAVKVTTLKSCKGLSFPIVVIAGLNDYSYSYIKRIKMTEERDEKYDLEKRALFVGMTRAMQRLLVVKSAHFECPVYSGFDQELWDYDTPIRDYSKEFKKLGLEFIPKWDENFKTKSQEIDFPISEKLLQKVSDKNKVRVGSLIQVLHKENDKVLKYKLVIPDAPLETEKDYQPIPIETKFGSEFVGKKVNDVISITDPKGITREFVLLDVKNPSANF